MTKIIRVQRTGDNKIAVIRIGTVNTQIAIRIHSRSITADFRGNRIIYWSFSR